MKQFFTTLALGAVILGSLTLPDPAGAQLLLTSPKPDLYIERVWDDGVRLYVTVHNHGTDKSLASAAKASWTEVQIQSLNLQAPSFVAWMPTPMLSSGFSATVWTYLPSGYRWSNDCSWRSALVDATNVVAESNESNNTLYLPLVGGACF